MPFTSKPTRRDFRELIAFATPIVAVQLGLMTMGVVDTIIVGHYSADGLAATALGNFYFFTIAVFGMGVLMVLDPVISQAVGARDEDAIALGLQRGLLIALGLSVVTGALLLPAGPVLRALHQPAEIVPDAARYTYLCLPGLFPFTTFLVLRQLLQSLGRLRSIVVTMVICNIANAALNWVFVFGHLGAPRMGVAGSAVATTISRGLLVVVLIAFSWRTIHGYLSPFRLAALDAGPMWRMLKLGLPIGAQQELEVSYFALLIVFMGLLGSTTVAAHQIAMNMAALTFMVPLGIGAATSVFVGRSIGAGDEDAVRRFALAGLVCGVGFMAMTAAMFLLLPDALVRLYTRDAVVASLAASLVPIAGVFQVFDGAQVVSAGILRGAGDTRAPMIISVLGFWLLGIPLSLFLGFGTGMGARGLWWGSVAALITVAVLLLYRVKSRLGRRMERILIDHPVPVKESLVESAG